MKAILRFSTEPFFPALRALFEELRIPVNILSETPASPASILGKQFHPDHTAHRLIRDVYALGMVDDSIFNGRDSFQSIGQVQNLSDSYNGLLIFGVRLELPRKNGIAPLPDRAALGQIASAFNRAFPYTPVMLVIQYDHYLTIVNTERIPFRQTWREGDRPGKVTMLKDIDIEQPHAGHVRILQALQRTSDINSYRGLYEYWQKVLDTQTLNRQFFQELANWYFWAAERADFPKDFEKDRSIRNSVSLIRLITRVIFVWFIREKSLVPDRIFQREFLKDILKDFNRTKKSANYYPAILQNLFFATLNQPMEDRGFASASAARAFQSESKNQYRFADLFSMKKSDILQLFADVPFLNGGLFDCQDQLPNLPDRKKTSTPLWVDGFTESPGQQPHVPDYLFFGAESEVDLNPVYGTKGRRYQVRGLFEILSSYKFTVAENTPVEEEVALDPELLGKVFENLLASYNPETSTTARKQTGSFYTPRDIVHYMVDESLIEYLLQHNAIRGRLDRDRLQSLLNYQHGDISFSLADRKALVEALSGCQILDPACGSGAFPMGVLQKMVLALQRVDPDNLLWQEKQRTALIQKQVQQLKRDAGPRTKKTDAEWTREAEKKLKQKLLEMDAIFREEGNDSDYARKIYLIENCIYGIDVQPIAVQIAKLRFFVSLIVDQREVTGRPNRGIRSLPNLETRFVAANTLIGLDKPKQLLLRDPQIEEKEEQLKQIRHRYFAETSRAEKSALRLQDETLRQQISNLLKSDGWKNEAAEKVARFNPYDQNSAASWFDPEWMFGITGGFDIVIGNPPWITYTHKELGPALTAYYKAKYSCAEGFKLNSFPMFVEESMNLAKSGGLFSLVIPNRLLDTPSYKGTREKILQREVILLENMPAGGFDAVVAGNIILSVANRKPVKDKIRARNFYTREELFIPLAGIRKHEVYQININRSPGASRLIEKINERKTQVLSDLCFVHVGMMVRDRGEVFSASRGKEKVVEGEDLARFALKGYKRFNLGEIEVFGGTKNEGKHRTCPKLLVRKTGNQVICSIDETGVFAEQSVYLVLPQSDHTDLYFLAALLNSKLCTFYFQNELITNPEAYPYIQHYDLERIPVRQDARLAPKINKLVKNILDTQKNKPGTSTSRLEAELDELIFKLFDLSPEEQELVMGGVAPKG